MGSQWLSKWGGAKYTPVEYIQSYGAQYIDTGFNPKSTTRIKMSAQFLGGDTTSALFGERSAASSTDSTSFTLLIISQKPRSDYFGDSKSGVQTVATTQIEIDWNKNICAIGDDTITHAAVSKASERPLYLFAANTAGSATLPAIMRLYACQIYDDGTLVRDFIPAKDELGNVGLYDKAGETFYYNAGIGVFGAPAAPIGTIDTLNVGNSVY